jgi:hypothetical protein
MIRNEYKEQVIDLLNKGYTFELTLTKVSFEKSDDLENDPHLELVVRDKDQYEETLEKRLGDNSLYCPVRITTDELFGENLAPHVLEPMLHAICNGIKEKESNDDTRKSD